MAVLILSSLSPTTREWSITVSIDWSHSLNLCCVAMLPSPNDGNDGESEGLW